MCVSRRNRCLVDRPDEDTRQEGKGKEEMVELTFEMLSRWPMAGVSSTSELSLVGAPKQQVVEPIAHNNNRQAEARPQPKHYCCKPYPRVKATAQTPKVFHNHIKLLPAMQYAAPTILELMDALD